MAKSYWGSINLSKLLEAAKAGNSAFIKAGEKKQIFVNVTLWENEAPDQYGNVMAMHTNPKKDSDDEKIYIINLKPSTVQPPENLKPGELNIEEDDLPF